MSEAGYNLRSPAVKRLMKEAAELKDPTELYWAQPLEDNLFEWHFTVRGPPDTDFQGGYYHGRISLPAQYPMKPPTIMLLTPNGRFETNKKICLSISGHHPESWQPSWSIRTALLAIIGFMPTHGAGAIGALDYSPSERRGLAVKSVEWSCSVCGCGALGALFPALTAASSDMGEEARRLAAQVSFQDEATTKTGPPASSDSGPASPLPSISSAPALINSGPSSPSGVRHRVASTRVVGGGVVGGGGGAVGGVGTGESGSSSLTYTAIVSLLSLTIALLIARRLYILNEWRWHPTQ